MLKLIRLVAGCAALTVLSAMAQQINDAAEFDMNSISELRGQAVRIWLTPPFVVVSVADQDERAESWTIVFHADRSGATDTVEFLRALRLGDELAITGHPSTDADELLVQATRIVRPSDDLAWMQ